MIELRECPICKTEEWESLDYLRDVKYWYNIDIREKDEPVGMKVCKECGFVTYDYIGLNRLTEHYDRERPVMTANNIITCNRKKEYHKMFLGETLLKLTEESNVLDIGTAQGSFLEFVGEKTKANLYGTEWSRAFRNFGKYEYDLNITEDMDDTIKYDLICYYHVLEHIQWPDKELKRIRELLKENGKLYISVPYFLEDLEEKSGTLTADFENLYHLNHVNIFSKTSFKNLLSQLGFEIEKENDRIYGYTVVCKKGEKGEIVKEDYIEIKKTLEKQKEAILLFNQKKFDEAIKVFPKYPDAYIGKALMQENSKKFELCKEIIEEGLRNNPDNWRLKRQLAQIYFQWDENKPKKQFYSNNIKEAERLFIELLEEKPGQEDLNYFLAMINMKYKKEYQKAVYYFKCILKINPLKFAEVYNMIAVCYKEI